MKNSLFRSRILAIVLTLMISVTMAGGSFLEAFAVEGEQAAANETEAVSDGAEQESDEEQAAVNEEAGQTAQETSADTESKAEETASEPVLEEAAPEEAATEEVSNEAVAPEEPAQTQLTDISVKAAGDENFITAVWSSAEDAAYYMVYLDASTTGEKVEATAERRWVFKNVSGGRHSIRVEAYRVKANAEATPDDGTESAVQTQTAEYELFAKGAAENINASLRPKLWSRGVGATYLGLSLRPMLGEGNNGYAVAQGAATDGKYGYFLMASSDNQKGRLIKINLSNPGEYYAGQVMGIHHGNGMTYDSKRNRLVCVGYGAWRQQLSFIDPNTLQLTSQQDVSYPYPIEGVSEAAKQNGLGAIAYVKEYDVFVARSRGRNNGVGDSYFNNDIWVINAENLKVIGHVYAHVTGQYPETYQSMDADAKYVYYLLSPGSGQSGNIILALDWDSENLLPVLNGEKEYVEYTWKANNDDSGNPDAVLTIPIGHESEGLFHTTDANGNAHFYVSEYYGRWKYKTVTKKYKVKKKWKKVRKWYNKKTKKWTTKKPKKKYRGKSKKVWKYKYKTKKKKVTVKDYWARDDYVYYIGSF